MGILKNPVLVWANIFGIEDTTAQNYYRAVWEHAHLEGVGFIEAWKATNREPEGLLFLRQLHSKMYSRLHKLGLEKAARANLREAQRYGRAYLEATREERERTAEHSWGPF